MKTVDYIIVGCGLAGIAFSEELRSRQRSWVIFDDHSQQSSTVAAGMYNPVILKRFTPVWQAKEQLQKALPLYAKLEKRLGLQLDFQFPLLRRFASIEEQNIWFAAADKPKLQPYLDLNLKSNSNPAVDAPYKLGHVKHAGRVFTERLVHAFQKDAEQQGKLIRETFDYSAIRHEEAFVSYKDFKAKQVIFAEGFGLLSNPFFNHLPLNGTKGEVLTVKISGLNLKTPIKSGVFIIPLGNDLYRVGATYNHDDKSNIPSEEGKTELLTKLQSFIKLPIEVIDHKAGIRPTTIDRRPLVGRHLQFKNYYVLNGFGSRGVMIAPYVADKLVAFIEDHQPLDQEIDICRFT